MRDSKEKENDKDDNKKNEENKKESVEGLNEIKKEILVQTLLFPSTNEFLLDYYYNMSF